MLPWYIWSQLNRKPLQACVMIGPPFFFFTSFLFIYMSCDHHVITYVTIVQVTYCPSDAIVLWPIVQVTLIVPVMSIILVTLLF